MYYPCDTHKENNCVFSKIYIIKICKETNKDDFVFFFFSLILLLYSINVHSVCSPYFAGIILSISIITNAISSSSSSVCHRLRECRIGITRGLLIKIFDLTGVWGTDEWLWIKIVNYADNNNRIACFSILSPIRNQNGNEVEWNQMEGL